MIVFNTEFASYFNKKIHEFLLVEFFDDYRQDYVLESLEWFFPKHLIREQKDKCAVVLEDLFDWTDDEYWHTMTAFHEIGLYRFLDYMRDLREDMPEFDSIYYDEEDQKEVKELWQKFDIEGMFEGSLKKPNDLGEFLHDIGTMQELCFDDADFLMLPILSNSYSIGDHLLEEMLGINIDYYKELLPNDIRARLEIRQGSSLYNDIKKMLELISKRVSHNGLHKDFWQLGKPRSEPEIQPLLDSLFALYFKTDEHADISREVDIGTGKIDFKFYKNPKEKVLIEVKFGNSSHLESGLKKQLIHYMEATNYDEAFYLVICHSSDDIRRTKKLYEKNKAQNFGKRIMICVLDVSEKVAPSKL
ncbi:MAG TPA: hypothetical protein VLF71_00980 [Candidatus Saccharimonadales bacterium]|nr:hypothetical protein [Candidatus Saccharimonadales bacterium]